VFTSYYGVNGVVEVTHPCTRYLYISCVRE